jgi:hypothetical protein
MSLYLGNNLIGGTTTPIEPTRNIGQIISSIIPLSDAGLHLLDGALIQGGGVYDNFVQYIADLSGSYHSCFTDETTWQNIVSSKGACGKFVYDSTNNTVRLPKIIGFVEGTVDSNALGDLIEAGLPNITGSFLADRDNLGGGSQSGALYKIPESGGDWTWPMGGSGAGTVNRAGLGLDASRSNSIYGNSNTVQPQSIKVFYYIVIATTTKTDIEVDIDEVSSDLNALTGQMSNLNTLVQQMSVVFNNLYPIGSVYLGIQNNGTCPIAALIPGSTWELVSQDRALWGGNGTNANTWIAAGLPNITGSFNRQCFVNYGDGTDWGALYTGSANSPQTAGGTSGGCPYTVSIDASRSSSIYGNSSTVQPPAYRVNVWVRTA